MSVSKSRLKAGLILSQITSWTKGSVATSCIDEVVKGLNDIVEAETLEEARSIALSLGWVCKSGIDNLEIMGETETSSLQPLNRQLEEESRQAEAIGKKMGVIIDTIYEFYPPAKIMFNMNYPYIRQRKHFKVFALSILSGISLIVGMSAGQKVWNRTIDQ